MVEESRHRSDGLCADAVASEPSTSGNCKGGRRQRLIIPWSSRASRLQPEPVRPYNPLLIVEDVSHSVRELRLQALGRTDTGRLLHIGFTLRGDGRLIRVISARTMHRKERLRYEHEA
ncbi:MAG: BrnT family toxin [Steroidobacteraceae bacterium]